MSEPTQEAVPLGSGPPDLAGTRALILHEQRFVEAYLGRREVEFPPARRALMIGPHPDDNCLGPGGTALQYVAAGIPVRWACLTDGRACVADPRERERMARVRPAEEAAAAALLGIDPPDLMNLPEDELPRETRREQAIEWIGQCLRRHRPDAVFVPWWLETHPLHRLTASLVARALAGHPEPCMVYSWATASFPPPLLVVDIGPVYERKRDLMRVYRSQNVLRDYVEDLAVLARLHASYGQPGVRYAEAFFAQEREAFVADVLARGLEHEATLRCGAQPLIDPEPGGRDGEEP